MGFNSVQAPRASHNCSGVARKRSSARVARAAGLVSPSARAFSMRRALTPSRSVTRLDNLMWASSKRDSNWFCSRTRSHLNWYFLRVTVRHRRCSASGTKLKVNSRATSRFTRRLASGKSLLRPRRPRLDSACARCNVPDFRLAPSRVSHIGFQYLSSASHAGFQYWAVPKCQTQARERWLAARERELLATDYFHVVFTVPHELNVLALENPRLFYDLLFTASAQTLLEIAIDRKHLGAEIGMISILHTWGQNLLLHPHIHCAIPAGGLSPDHRCWIRPRYPFFLPVKVLSRVFRGKFLAGLKRLHSRNKLCCSGPAAALADPQQFAKLLRRLHRHDWVVFAKPAFGGPMQVLRYLGRYTHRVAISNHRLLAFDQERVTFRWKDYAHGGKQGRMTLGATEFLRRFFLHVLPRGFVRIRHFGFLANRFRASRLALSRQLLSSNSTPPAEGVICATSSQTSSLWHCPRCGAAMIVIQRFTAAELSTCCYFDSS